MITSNVIQRIFHIRYASGTGTAFAIDRNGKQYLITANHVVKGITSGDNVGLFHKRRWKNVVIDVVGVGSNDIDVAVLACQIQLAPNHPLEASMADLQYGQTVYFLGFPFGWDSGMENINRDLPMPFVKAGVLSAMVAGDDSRIYIDAHGNKGFSGGPVVFIPNGRSTSEFRVAGVVAKAPRPRLEAVVDRFGQPILGEDAQPLSYFPENQGFVVAFGIRHATDLIEANPIGFPLLTEEEK